jgi:hypothetical protein
LTGAVRDVMWVHCDPPDAAEFLPLE